MQRMGARTRLRRSPKLKKNNKDATHLTRVSMRRMATRKNYPALYGLLGIFSSIFLVPMRRMETKNNRINLYVDYYKAVGGSGGYHSPKNCLPGGWWAFFLL